MNYRNKKTIGIHAVFALVLLMAFGGCSKDEAMLLPGPQIVPPVAKPTIQQLSKTLIYSDDFSSNKGWTFGIDTNHWRWDSYGPIFPDGATAGDFAGVSGGTIAVRSSPSEKVSSATGTLDLSSLDLSSDSIVFEFGCKDLQFVIDRQGGWINGDEIRLELNGVGFKLTSYFVTDWDTSSQIGSISLNNDTLYVLVDQSNASAELYSTTVGQINQYCPGIFFPASSRLRFIANSIISLDPVGGSYGSRVEFDFVNIYKVD